MSAHRILFVEASIGGVLGGSLTGILHLIGRMDRRRYAPEVVLYEDKPVVARLRADGVPVHILPPLPDPTPVTHPNRTVRALLRFRELWTVALPRTRALLPLLRRERPDLVYLANGITTNLGELVAAVLAGLPVIMHEKGLQRVGPAERLMSRWIDVCIGMTDHVLEHYRSRGYRARRFLTIYDGIDTEEFPPGGGEAVRRELGIPLDAPVVGIVGHLQRWKGQLLVVDAVARARRRHPDLRCLLVGGAHRLGGNYVDELRGRITAAGLDDCVILTGERSDVAACLAAVDVAIHSSLRPEPFGRVLIEAMALGRPLIAPREGGPLAIVVDGETGILVPPRDADALADAIHGLLTDPARRAAMGRAARARIDAVFDIRHHVAAVQALFDEVLGPPEPSPQAAVASPTPAGVAAPMRGAEPAPGTHSPNSYP